MVINLNATACHWWYGVNYGATVAVIFLVSCRYYDRPLSDKGRRCGHLYSLFAHSMPHGDGQQAVYVVGPGAGLEQQEGHYGQAHAQKHPPQSLIRYLTHTHKEREKEMRQG